MLWSAHVDWITTTWRQGGLDMDGAEARSLYDWACMRSGQTKEQLPLLRWAWQGYVGWSAGQIDWGERLDGSIIRVSGDLAGHYWSDNLPIGHNVSRLDVAVDVWWGEDPDTYIALHNVETLDARVLAAHRRWRVACVNGYGDGDTLYIGSRTSNEFVRIYNKYKESKCDERYKGCTRYEVEYHNESAAALVHRGGVRRSSSSFLLGEVSSLLHRRGVGVLSSLLASEPTSAPTRRIVTPDERKLDWLRTGVSPTVRHLLTRYSREDILNALGLDAVSRETAKLRS
jgi:hypothetical protein